MALKEFEQAIALPPKNRKCDEIKREQELFSSRRILYVMNLWLVRGRAKLMIAFTVYYNYYFSICIFRIRNNFVYISKNDLFVLCTLSFLIRQNVNFV